MRVSTATWLPALALAVLAAAVHAPALGNDFVNYDDDLYITQPAQVAAGITPEGVRWAFTSTQGANWFPLTRLSWMLDAQVHGLDPRGFHATSVALHALNAALLFLALARLSGQRGRSAIVAALFAVHPLHVESVAWAASRKDVLAGCFAMLTLLAYERAARVGGARRHVLVALLLALGLMAKPVLVVMPIWLLLLDAWPLGRFSGGAGGAAAVRRCVVEKWPLFAVAVATGVATLLAQGRGGTVQSLARYPLGLRVENAVVALLTYLRRAFWPDDLAPFYPHPVDTLATGLVVGAAVLIVGLTATALALARSRPHLAVGWLWLLVGLAPVIGIVQVGQAALADRYTYLPLIGLWIALVWEVGSRVPAVAWARRAALAAAVVAVALLGAATLRQSALWRDSQTLFEHTLSVTEANHVAHINLGVVMATRGEHDLASRHLAAARRISPRSATAVGALGEVRLAQDRVPEAEALFRRALALEPGSARWRRGLAVGLQARGQHAEAARLLESLRESEGESADVLLALGQARLDAGDVEGAGQSLARAAALAPDAPAPHALLGVQRERSGDRDGAIASYRDALRLGLDAPGLQNNLAWLLLQDPELEAAGIAEALTLAEAAVAATGGREPAMLDTLETARARAGEPLRPPDGVPSSPP